MKDDRTEENKLILSAFNLVSTSTKFSKAMLDKFLASENLEIVYLASLQSSEKSVLSKFSKNAEKLNYGPLIFLLAEDTINLEEKFYLYLLAANMGYAYAQLKTGYNYFNGIGTKKSTKLAKKFYLLAAKKNIASAYFNLGLMFETNSKEAIIYFKKAAKLGHSKSMLLVAKKILMSEKKFTKECLMLLKNAAALGQIEANDFLIYKNKIQTALLGK